MHGHEKRKDRERDDHRLEPDEDRGLRGYRGDAAEEKKDGERRRKSHRSD